MQEYDFLYKPGDLHTTPAYVGICFFFVNANYNFINVQALASLVIL